MKGYLRVAASYAATYVRRRILKSMKIKTHRSHDHWFRKEWRDIRKKALERDKYKCIVCNSTKNLQAHHVSYNRLGKSDEYKDLVTMCHRCHERYHKVPSPKMYAVVIGRWLEINRD